MNKVIVIGYEHRNTLGLVRSLGEAGLKPVVVCLSPKSVMVASSKYVGEFFYVDEQKLGTFLLENFKDELEKPVVMFSADMAISLVEKAGEPLKKKFFLFSSNGNLSQYIDKERTRKIAEDCGLLTPQTHIITKDTIEDVYSYPCLIKARSSLIANKSENKLINSFEELKEKVTPGIEYQLQEYIDKDYELLLPWCALPNGDVIDSGVLRKFRQYPWNKGGTSYAVLEESYKYPEVDKEAVKRLVNMIGYSGLFSVELAVKDGKAYFLEMNVRNDATGYVVTRAGLNLPYIWYQSVIGGDYEINKCTYPTYMMADDVDYKNVYDGKITRDKWLEDLAKTDCYLLYNDKDIKPYIKFKQENGREW